MVETQFRAIVPITFGEEDFFDLMLELNFNRSNSADVYTLQKDWIMALGASRYNGNHQDSYIVEMHSKERNPSIFPKHVYAGLGLKLLDEIPLISSNGLGLVDILQSSRPEMLDDVALALKPNWEGQIFRGQYPISSKNDLDSRSDSHMIVLQSDSSKREDIIKVLQKIYGTDFALSIEEPKSVVSFLGLPLGCQK